VLQSGEPPDCGCPWICVNKSRGFFVFLIVLPMAVQSSFFLDLYCHGTYNATMNKRDARSGKGPGRARAEVLQVRLSPPEKSAFERAAQIAGVDLSSWVRERLRVAALRELDNVGEAAPFLTGPAWGDHHR
jgi:hypothetical protein